MGQIGRGGAVDGTVAQTGEFVLDTLLNGEPMESLQDRCNVITHGGTKNKPCS